MLQNTSGARAHSEPKYYDTSIGSNWHSGIVIPAMLSAGITINLGYSGLFNTSSNLPDGPESPLVDLGDCAIAQGHALRVSRYSVDSNGDWYFYTNSWLFGSGSPDYDHLANYEIADPNIYGNRINTNKYMGLVHAGGAKYYGHLSDDTIKSGVSFYTPEVSGKVGLTSTGDLWLKGTKTEWHRSNTTDQWNAYHNSSGHLVFKLNSTSMGYFASSGGSNVQLNNFTGQHRCEDKDDILSNAETGLIVVSTGKYNNLAEIDRPTINESLPVVTLATERNQKSAFGVLSNKEDKNGTVREYSFGNFVSVHDDGEELDRLIINSLGEGAIWVCNINGNLENGDYITTCEIPGYGMKQDDDILHNYTVAKITQDCNFRINASNYDVVEFELEGQTYRKAFVGCTYHCG